MAEVKSLPGSAKTPVGSLRVKGQFIVIVNQSSHYVFIWDFLIPGPILYLKGGSKYVFHEPEVKEIKIFWSLD